MFENALTKFRFAWDLPKDEQIQVQTETAGAVTIVRVIGDAGTVNASKLHAELQDVAATGPAVAIVDLAEVTYLASAGMGALVAFVRKMKAHQGEVRVAVPRGRTRDMLEIARLQTVLNMQYSVEAGLAANVG